MTDQPAPSDPPTTAKAPQTKRAIEKAQTAAAAAAAADPMLAALRAPFPPEAIGKLPRSTCKACSESQRKRCEQHQWVSHCPECRGSHSSATMHIDYVGHADVTDRLLQVDPAWTWEPAMRDQFGQPSIASSIDRDGNLWINLTVAGVTRPGVGDGKNAKEKIGDALRNAAMRFGVALDLWAKGDRDWAHAEKTGTDQHPDGGAAPAPQADPPAPAWHGPTSLELLDIISQHAITAGTTLENITGKFRAEHGDVTVEALESCPPQLLADLEASIAKFLRENPPSQDTPA